MNRLKQIGATLYRLWMKFAHGLAFVNTVFLLTLVYVLIIGPIALVLKVLGKDLLERKSGADESFWKTKEATPRDTERLRHQF